MFTIDVSDGKMEIGMIPSLNGKLTEKQLEEMVAMFVCFYALGHNGTLPSSKEVQNHIDYIVKDYD